VNEGLKYIRSNIAYWKKLYSDRGADISFSSILVGLKTASAIETIRSIDGIPVYQHSESNLDYLITRDGFYLMMMERDSSRP
jgi:hypothetical protein